MIFNDEQLNGLTDYYMKHNDISISLAHITRNLSGFMSGFNLVLVTSPWVKR